MVKIHVIDAHFQGEPQVIACYLLEGPEGLVLIETGPSTVIDAVVGSLQTLGFRPADVRAVLVTHIHLDHAGAAGWWAQQGAHVYVHRLGAPHLIDPSRLWASAKRIYGEEMERLWGQMLPIHSAQLTALRGGETVTAGGLEIVALDTPGHAWHHLTYRVGDTAFTGDVGGASVPGHAIVDAATPPPEFDLMSWQESLERLLLEEFSTIYLTHFGQVQAVEEHLLTLRDLLHDVAELVRLRLADGETIEEITAAYAAWNRGRLNLPPDVAKTLAFANPPHMSVNGIMRYWQMEQSG